MALRRCRITLTCERDKVFPTSRLDEKTFCWLFSGGLNVGRSRAGSAFHGNTERSVQTKQQMHGVNLNFLKPNKGCKQSTQQIGARLLQSGSGERLRSSSPTQGGARRDGGKVSHGLDSVTSGKLGDLGQPKQSTCCVGHSSNVHLYSQLNCCVVVQIKPPENSGSSCPQMWVWVDNLPVCEVATQTTAQALSPRALSGASPK